MEHETTSIFSIWNISVYVMAGMYSGGMTVVCTNTRHYF